MKKKKGVIPKSSIACCVLALACVLCWLVLDLRGAGMPGEVVFPASGLDDSIFELQNMVYEKQSGLSESVTVGAYLADAPSGKSAQVGKSTLVLGSGYYFLYSSIAEGAGAEGVIASSYSGVLSPQADPLAASAERLDGASGNLHGCGAEYGLYAVTAGSGETGYAAVFTLKPYGAQDGERLVIGCMTTAYDTAQLANAHALARAVVGTVRPQDGGK